MNNQNITIVGGGSSGWIVASALIKAFPNKKISVVESRNIPIIGVGESTYEGIRKFCKFLEIEESDFFSYTDASIKIGIAFKNFYNLDDEDYFIYPFGNPFLNDTKYGVEDWMIKKYLNNKIPSSDFSDSFYPQSFLIKENSFNENINNEFELFDPNLDTALHFDAIKFGSWLKNKYCIPRGVNLIVGDVDDATINDEGIECIFVNGEAIYSDIYIDCTGFNAILIDKILNEPFISYSDYLPNDSAWATQIPYKNKELELRPVTTCTALKNGWCWDIPLWSRLGSGYVFSSKFTDDESALNEFKEYLSSNNVIEKRSESEIEQLNFKKIAMRVGIHERPWVKNVVAIGLSAGFIEPLESNGLFTVWEFVYQLIRAIERPKTNGWDVSVFNDECRKIYHGFAEFIMLHYALSIRNDSEYWNSNIKRNFSFSNFDFLNEFSSHTSELRVRKSRTNVANPYGGITCIATGMNYNILDSVAISLKEIESNGAYLSDIQFYLDLLDIKKNKWQHYAKNSKSLKKYLEDKYYYNDK